MQSFTQTEYLTILSHAPADNVKSFADSIIPYLGTITVLQNRTGLVMLPYTDTAKGSRFHLGEVLVAEALVQLESGVQGYAACVGRDMLQALAAAIIDAAMQSHVQIEMIETFLQELHETQRQTDDTLLRQVEATRIEMETF